MMKVANVFLFIKGDCRFLCGSIRIEPFRAAYAVSWLYKAESYPEQLRAA
jgi:hypothetical protein